MKTRIEKRKHTSTHTFRYDHYNNERTRLVAPKHAKNESITALAVSSRSEMLLCGHKNGCLVLWNLTSFKMLHRLLPRKGDTQASCAVQDIVFLNSMRALVLRVSCVATFVQYRTKLLGSGFNVQQSKLLMGEKDTASIAALDHSSLDSSLALTIHGSRNMTTLIFQGSMTRIPSSEEQCSGYVALHSPDPKFPVRCVRAWSFNPCLNSLQHSLQNVLEYLLTHLLTIK